jgi:hypothetical protein
MTLTTDTHRIERELAHRTSNGVEVTLLWLPADDRLVVSVVDARLGEAFEIDVDAAEALDAFHHPYAYAAFRRVEAIGLRVSEAELLQG